MSDSDLHKILYENYGKTKNDDEYKHLFDILKPWYDRDVKWKQNHSATIQHKFFEIYKDVHKHRTGVILTGADTINNMPLHDHALYNNSIKVGMNWMNSSKYKEDLDYYFFGSYYNNNDQYKNIIENYNNKNNTLVKFASVFREGIHVYRRITKTQISKMQADKLGAYSFDTCLSSFDMNTDITTNRILGNSVIFPAVSFLLYTGVSKIYLIGADCTIGKVGSDYSGEVVYLWNVMKQFIKKNYPQTEIISVNPIGLKNLFTDIYI